MQQVLQRDYLKYIHYFRGLAIILIVAVHCRTSIPWEANSMTQELLVYGLDFSTILFVFISGFLFYHLTTDRFDYAGYLRKKIKFILLPYVIVSIPALADKLFIETDLPWMSPTLADSSLLVKTVYMLMTGKHSGPFYFIPMIFIVFILAPVFRYISKTRYFDIITAAIVLLGMFSYNYGYYTSILISFWYFFPIYLFGMWTSKNKERIFSYGYKLMVPLILIYITIYALEFMGVITVSRLYDFEYTYSDFSHFNWAKLKIICSCLIFIYFFKQVEDKPLSPLKRLGDYSFGIYFVHIYFIGIVEHVARIFQFELQQNLFVFVIYLAYTIGFSALVVWCVKKVFGDRSRLIMGS